MLDQSRKARSQIPGAHHQDSFSPVIYDTTFRIKLVIWIKYKWGAKIIDIETAFLYRNLEEDISLKIPDGKKNTHKQENQQKYLPSFRSGYLRVRATCQEIFQENDCSSRKEDVFCAEHK